MDAQHVMPRGRWRGLCLAMTLSFAFLAICLWWVSRALELVLAGNVATASLDVVAALGSPLLWQLVHFAASLFLCHFLLGLSAFALARLTEAAFGGTAIARRRWFVAGWLAVCVGLVVAANTTWHPSSIFAGAESWWRNEYLGQEPVVYALAGAALGVILLAWRAVPWPPPRNARRGATIAAAAVAA